jgi:hypothetical protein
LGRIETVVRDAFEGAGDILLPIANGAIQEADVLTS